MLTPGSTYITDLKVKVLFDISLPTPVVKLINQSTGPDLPAVDMAFWLYGPNNQEIHVGDLNNPDAAGNFTEYTFDEPFPPFGNSIEWSGGPYRVVIKAKDPSFNEYTFSPEQKAEICRPKGNEFAGKNYGEAKLDIESDCNKGELYVNDVTNYNYRGLPPNFVSKKITIIPPSDGDGNVPTPSEYIGYSKVLHVLTASGQGFTAIVVTVVEYSLGNNVFVRLKFIKTQAFNVNCNYDLCPLMCEYDKLVTKAEEKCDPALNEKMILINAKLLAIYLAYSKPACGLNVGDMIEELKQFAGFSCDCSCSGIGINSSGTTNGGWNFQFNTCGDISANAAVNGQNVLLTINDKTYTFAIGATTSNAFTWTTGVDGCTRIPTLHVSTSALSIAILNFIKSDVDATNLFNSIVNIDFSQIKLLINGKCVLATNGCDYEATLVDVCDPTDIPTPIGIFKHIKINGIVYAFNMAFSFTNLTPIQTILNALNKGNFVVSINQESIDYIITITSANNPNDIQEIVFEQVCGTDILVSIRYMQIEKTCGQPVLYSAQQIVQAIVDYLCAITAKQVTIDTAIPYCKPISGDNSAEIMAGSSVHAGLTELAANQCDIVTYLLAIKTVNCANIKAIHPQLPALQINLNTDGILGTKQGQCATIGWTEIANAVSNIIFGGQTFCQAVAACATPVCGPVQNFVVTKEEAS